MLRNGNVNSITEPLQAAHMMHTQSLVEDQVIKCLLTNSRRSPIGSNIALHHYSIEHTKPSIDYTSYKSSVYHPRGFLFIFREPT